MPTVAYITNASPNSGVGNRADNIKHELDVEWGRNDDVKMVQYEIDGVAGNLLRGDELIASIKPYPGLLGSKSINWIRLANYLKKDIKGSHYDVIHATNQTLSFLIDKTIPSVVTVHDIIEVIEPQSTFGGIISRFLYSGIRRANHIIAVSEYTAKTIQKHYGIANENVTVIPNGVGLEFCVIDNFEQTVAGQMWRQNLRISTDTKVILYVGSEHPRKNLSTALEAFAKVRKDAQDIIFVKVGDPGLLEGRKTILDKIESLNIRDAVRLVGNVSTDDLNALYNLADVFIYPSTFEGFGLPPLQAMAAGTPVITSNATSLPEVVGEAGFMHESLDVDGFTDSMTRLLKEPVLYKNMQKKGLARVKQFTWESAAQAELMVYKKLIASRS